MNAKQPTCPHCERPTRDLGGSDWCSGCQDFVVDRVLVVDVGVWWSRVLLALGGCVRVRARNRVGDAGGREGVVSELRNVRIEHGHHPDDDGPGIWIYTPYSEAFVAAIKQIPAGQRAWDSEDLAWFVREDFAQEATALVVAIYGETIVVRPDGSEEYRDLTGTTARQERLF